MSLQNRRKKNLKKELGLIHSKDERIFYSGIEALVKMDVLRKVTSPADYALDLIKYIAVEDKLEKILENQQVIKTPIVRNGKQSTIGYQPDEWKKWS